jgi:hypothetical protein
MPIEAHDEKAQNISQYLRENIYKRRAKICGLYNWYSDVQDKKSNNYCKNAVRKRFKTLFIQANLLLMYV